LLINCDFSYLYSQRLLIADLHFNFFLIGRFFFFFFPPF